MMTKRRISLLVLMALVLALAVLRLMLPAIVERTVNSRLERMGDYRGHVDDVDLALWRGAYTLHALRIDKVDGEVPVPLLEAPRTVISLSWRHLLRGAIVAEALFDQPTVHFVDGRQDADSQTGRGVDWRARLEALTPTRIDEVVIRDGRVVFHNFVSDPPVDIDMTGVDATVLNLTNVRNDEGERVAELTATATARGGARIESEARFDPIDRQGDFQFALRVLDIQLTEINDLAQAYANLDFESGNGELVMELEAVGGHLTGYAKPLFQDIQIFSWRNDIADARANPFRIAWEAVVEGVTTVFKNQPADQFGTRIDISGDIGDAELGTYSAIVGVLRNAFVNALQPYFEGTHLRSRDD